MPTKKRKVPDSGFEQESNCSDEKIDRKDVNVFEKLTKFLNDEYPTLESFLEIAESKVSITYTLFTYAGEDYYIIYVNYI